MPSKRILDREESSLAVEQAAIVWGAQAAAALVSQLAAELEQGPPGDLGQLVRFLARGLERSRTRLTETELAREGARLAWQVQVRRRRAAAVELRRHLLAVRALRAGSLPETTFSGRLARHPGGLLRQAGDVLRDLGRTFADPAVAPTPAAGVRFDPRGAAEAIDSARRALVEAHEAAAQASAAAARASAERQRATAAHDATYRRAARLLTLLLETAGMEGRARRIRSPRRRGTPAVAEGPAVNGAGPAEPGTAN